MEHDYLLLTHLLSTHLQSKSVAISLTYYPNICLQTHLLSTQLRSHSFAIICYPASTAIDTFAIRPICFQFSVAINNYTINHHLLQNFRLPLNPYFYHFFSPKNLRKKWKKFSTFGILHSLANFAGAWNQLILLPQVKVSTFWKILTTTCTKTRHTIHRSPTGVRNTETDAKHVAVLQKESNEQVFIATC